MDLVLHITESKVNCAANEMIVQTFSESQQNKAKQNAHAC